MRTVVLVAFVQLLLPLSAQETNKSLLSGDKCWTMQYKAVLAPAYGDVYSYEETRLDGDTLIEGIHFKRKYCRSWQQGEPRPEKWLPMNEYLGQSGDKVYTYSHSYSDPERVPRLSMDFAASVGDVVQVGVPEWGDSYTVVGISEVVLADSDDKTVRRCIQVRYGGTGQADVWIEGVGSLLYGVSSTSPLGGSVPHLYNCVEDSRLLYQWDIHDSGKTLISGDNCWTMRYESDRMSESGNRYILAEMTLANDTVIGSINYKRIRVRHCSGQDSKYGKWTFTDHFLGQDGDKVYLYSTVNKQSRLIMDFSAERWLTVPVKLESGEVANFVVTSAADTLFVTPDGPFSRRCIHTQMVGAPTVTDVWVRGIGSLIYGITPFLSNDGSLPQLWQFVSDGKIIYQHEQMPAVITVVPHQNDYKYNKEKYQYNLQGRRVKSQGVTGVYIQNGRKRVVR